METRRVILALATAGTLCASSIMALFGPPADSPGFRSSEVPSNFASPPTTTTTERPFSSLPIVPLTTTPPPPPPPTEDTTDTAADADAFNAKDGTTVKKKKKKTVKSKTTRVHVTGKGDGKGSNGKGKCVCKPSPSDVTTTTTTTTTTDETTDPPTTTAPPTTSQPPTDPGGSGIIPPGATLLFNGDFNTGDLSQYANAQAEGVNDSPEGTCAGTDGRICVVNGGPGHETAAKFELHPGDVAPGAGGERAELRVGDEGDTAPGDERWYSFDLMFDNWPPPDGENSGGHMIVMQWHTHSGSPLLTLNTDASGNFTIGERWGDDWGDPAVIGPIDEGVWHSYVVHVVFSTGGDGLIEVYRDGELAASRNQATHNDDDNYLKLGIYRGGEDEIQSLLYDSVQIFAP